MLQPLARLLWEPADGKLIDQRFVKRHDNGDVSYQVWEYMVEVAGPDVTAHRLTIKAQSHNLVGINPGDTVPVLVNKKLTKAEFDLGKLRGSRKKSENAREKAQKAADEARFQARRDGLDEEAVRRQARAAEDQALAELGDSPEAAELREELARDRELEDLLREDEESV